MDEYKLVTDPKIIGPGVWYNIHTKAKLAVDASTKEDFIKEMYFQYHNFPCLNCRNHIQEYMETHPIEPFYTLIDENGKDVGLFKWTWLFHNTVNKRLNKKYMDWETAYNIYNLGESSIKPCTSCGSDKTKIIQNYFNRFM